MAKKNEVPTELKKGRAQFMIIGAAKMNDYTFKIDNEYDSGWVDNQLNLGIDCGNGNVVYTEMRGGYSKKNDNVLYVHGIKNDGSRDVDDFENRFQIDWEDRFEENVIETIGNNCFITVGVEKDNKGKIFSKRFLSAYDAIAYLSDHLEDGMIVNVKGNLTYSEYDEKIRVRKEITSIFLSKAESEEEYKATFTQTILLDSDSIGKKDAEKGTIGLTAYVVDYVGKVDIDGTREKIGKNVSFPINFEVAINNDKPEITAKMLQRFFKVAKRESITEITIEGELIEGQSIINVSEDDIPEDIKELISLGLYSQEEAEAKVAIGNVNRERRMVIQRPAITYVGKNEDRKATVAVNEDRYKVGDLVFLSQLIAEFENQDYKEDEDGGVGNKTESKSKSKKDKDDKPPFKTEEDNDEDEFLKMLNSI